MSAPVLRRVAVAALILIGAGVGWRLRSEAAEDGRRRDLVAEIEREMAARAIPPLAPGPEVPEEEDAAVLYARAFAAILPGPLEGGLRSDSFVEGGEVPAPYAAALEANREALALLDRAAALPRCRFGEDRAMFGKAMHACTLLRVRGLTQFLEGDGAGVVATVGQLRRIARHFAGFPSNWRHSLVFTTESTAVGVLSVLARSPALDEATAVAALAAAEGPWGIGPASEAMAALQVREFDRICIHLLGPGYAAYMQAHGIPVSSGIDRVLDVLPFGSGRTTPRDRPTVAEVREAREATAELAEAIRRGDRAALAPDGSLARRFAATSPGGWAPAHFGGLIPSYVVWDKGQVARVDLARAALALRIREFRTGRPPGGPDGEAKGLRFDLRSDGWTLTVDLPTGPWPHPYGPINFPSESIAWTRPAK
jgi:hypothetical protein